MSKHEYNYVVYDGRYLTDPDRATVMFTADTLEEAQRERADWGVDCVIVRHEVIGGVAISSEVMPNK